MKILEIIRLESFRGTPEARGGTIGVLRINKKIFCYTLELPDLMNQRNTSSIPTGQYACVPFKSTRFGVTRMIRHVPGRSNVLFHAGNSSDDTQGCVLLGETVGKLKGDRAVLNSGETFRQFIDTVGKDPEVLLTITENY